MIILNAVYIINVYECVDNLIYFVTDNFSWLYSRLYQKLIIQYQLNCRVRSQTLIMEISFNK